MYPITGSVSTLFAIACRFSCESVDRKDNLRLSFAIQYYFPMLLLAFCSLLFFVCELFFSSRVGMKLGQWVVRMIELAGAEVEQKPLKHPNLMQLHLKGPLRCIHCNVLILIIESHSFI